jgi:hypothetical protein
LLLRSLLLALGPLLLALNLLLGLLRVLASLLLSLRLLNALLPRRLLLLLSLALCLPLLPGLFLLLGITFLPAGQHTSPCDYRGAYNKWRGFSNHKTF